MSDACARSDSHRGVGENVAAPLCASSTTGDGAIVASINAR